MEDYYDMDQESLGLAFEASIRKKYVDENKWMTPAYFFEICERTGQIRCAYSPDRNEPDLSNYGYFCGKLAVEVIPNRHLASYRCEDCPPDLGRGKNIIDRWIKKRKPGRKSNEIIRWILPEEYFIKTSDGDKLCSYSPSSGNNRNRLCGFKAEFGLDNILEYRCSKCSGKNGRCGIVINQFL